MNISPAPYGNARERALELSILLSRPLHGYACDSDGSARCLRCDRKSCAGGCPPSEWVLDIQTDSHGVPW